MMDLKDTGFAVAKSGSVCKKMSKAELFLIDHSVEINSARYRHHRS
jgi:hypothetical protein